MRTPHTPSGEAARPAAPHRPQRRWWSAATAVVGLGAVLVAGGWWWSGSEGSLAMGLRLTSALLPAGLSLHSSGVRGSLRHGGQIDVLQWQQDGLRLQLAQVQLKLDATRLQQGLLPLHELRVALIEASPLPARQTSPPVTQLLWPLRAQLAWRIDTLRWQATAPIEAHDLQGTYDFNGQQHALQLDSLRLADGHYQGQLILQGSAPMALDAQLEGQLRLPKSGGTVQSLQAKASLAGPLGGPQASLTLNASLSPSEASAEAPRLTVQGDIQPQAERPISALQARLQRIDLATLWPGAPQTRLDGSVQAKLQTEGWQLQVALDNGITGPWDRGRVPLEQLRGQLLHKTTGWMAPALQVRWPGGGLQGQAMQQNGTWQGQWQIDRLQPGQWLSTLQGPDLSGPITLQGNEAGALQWQARLQTHKGAPATDGSAPGLNMQASWQDGTWTVSQLNLNWAEAHIEAQGRWSTAEQQLKLQTRWQLPGLSAQLAGALSPRQGQGQWQLEGQDTPRLWRWLQRWPALRTSLQRWSAPGALQASGQWQGGWAAEGLQVQGRLSTAQFEAQASSTLQHMAVNKDWRGQLDRLQIHWPGLPAGAAPAALALETPARWLWQGQRLQWLAHRWTLTDPAGQANLLVEDGDWQAPLRAGALPRLHARAQLSELPLRWATWLGLPAMQGDLLLQGGLNLALDERPQAQVWLGRQRGDLQLGTDMLPGSTRRLSANLRTARARLLVDGPQARLDLDWDSAQAGQLNAQLQSRLDLNPKEGLAGLWPAQAPLAGQVNARLPSVGAWSWLAPPGWRVQGTLDAHAQISGTRAQPLWTGEVQADQLAARSAVEGIAFGQGRLRARLQQQEVVLEELRLLGVGAQGGEVSAQGRLRWLPETGAGLQTVQMDLDIQAKSLRVSSRVDRRLSVSGQVRARMDRGQMQLRGQLQADSAQFILSEDSTPTLGRDVRVLGSATPAAIAAPGQPVSVMPTPDVQVQLNLGPDFLLHGQGITTRLTGEVQLSSSAATGGQPRLVGQVRTEGGMYRAYGQQLDIEQGLLRFGGPYDNPALDILALRPNLGQRVGVRVTGTAQVPRIRLYADPDMPDADKLAWLVLGRSPAAGGAESAVLQQAALALLGGSGKGLGGELANALGFDEISLASRSTTTAAGTTASGTAVMLSKRLSKDFYMVYESSVSGAFGSLFIFYDLSRKLSLRAQTGEINALDLIYSIRYD